MQFTNGLVRIHRRLPFRFLIILSLVSIHAALLPESISGQNTQQVPADSIANDSLVLTNADSVPEKKKELAWNEFDLGFTTVKIGGGYIGDYVTYSQDEKGQAQSDSLNIELEPIYKTRDFRFITSGQFKTKMSLGWKMAIMYDGDNEEWLVRETGLVIGLPKWSSQVFIGRTKEGFSMPKIMNGHSPWTMERLMAVDLVPIMADGIRWYTYLPKSRVFWTLAGYNDVLSEGQKFSTFESQYLIRLGWLSFYQPEKKQLLHIAGYYRYGKPLDGKFQVRSRPESNPTPYFIDTGKFPTDHSTHFGGEIYYTSGCLQFGTEYYVHNFLSDVGEDFTFPGGDISISYIFTGESRPYSTTGNIYGFVPVKNPLGKGGFGAWEGVLRYSFLDLDDGSILGGQLWRITPMVNWYMNKVVRMEFVYGYSVLDRFNIQGGTQFFQTRIQFTVN